MITIEKLKSFGANTDEGLARCLNNESFYLMLVQSSITFEQIDKLCAQTNAGDLDGAFETAHALKGVYANLSLTPLYKLVYELTEQLRSKKNIDYSPITTKLRELMAQLQNLAQ